MRKRIRKNNQGFTLVELIVVLVILAILAAILVPALLGYIDRAKEEQNILKAKNCMTAAQAVWAEQYAENVSLYHAIDKNEGHDTELRNSEAAKEMLELADDDPYVLIIGVGSEEAYQDTDPHRCYTVYSVIYWAAADSDPIFFNGSEWTTVYPWEGKKSGDNTFYVASEGADVELSFYIVTAPTGWKDSDTWNNLKNYLKKTGNYTGK